MSDAAKLAWAAQQGVDVPASLRQRVAAVGESASATELRSAVKDSSCRVTLACCEDSAAVDRISCDATAVAVEDVDLTVRFVTLSAQQKCRGLAPIVALFSAALPLDLSPLWRPDVTVTGWTCCSVAFCDHVRGEPPVPPPR